MSLGYARSTSFSLISASLVLAFFCLPNEGHAQPVPVTKIENAAGDSVLTVFEDGGFVVYGERTAGSIPIEGAGTRMMWYPAQAAFRAGQVDTEWNVNEIGETSVAFGENTEASGQWSTALGNGSVASAQTSTAIGSRATASGRLSMAVGFRTTASDRAATAMGDGAIASGPVSTAMGQDTEASGRRSTAMGQDTEASGDQSTAMGFQTTASSFGSTAMGGLTTAATSLSLTIGRLNDANRGNDDSDSETGPLFVVGNGQSTTDRSDALVLDQSGDLEISGTLTETSDRRLKEQIQPLGTGVLAPLSEIEPVRFHFKDERTHPSGEQIGLIAQEVQAQFPALVSEGSSGYLSVSYSKFTAVLLKGLQEQQVEIGRLQAKVSRMEHLEARLAKLEQQDTSRLAILGGPWSAVALLTVGLLGLGMFARRQQRA